jgi:isopenicillin N synthase-like dioxygenase
MTIDYSKLNNRIVEQAQEASRSYFTLSEDQKQELFRNKVERAKAMLKSREIYLQIED